MKHPVVLAFGLNLPGTQGKHAADASSGWYLPDGQFKPLHVLFCERKERREEIGNVKNYYVYIQDNLYSLTFC